MKIQSLTIAFFCLVFWWGFAGVRAQSPDTLRILAIRVAFQQDDDPTTTGDGTFDLSVPEDRTMIDPPPHNRSYFQDHLLFVRNYFRRISHGRLIVEADVFPKEQNTVYQLDQPMANYNPNTSARDINEGLARLLRDALQEADKDPDIDFSRYQSFLVFHAGVGKDIDLGFDDTPRDIPSLFLTEEFLQEYLGEAGIPVQDGQVLVKNGIILPETESQAGLEIGLNGMIVSNIGSQLGWLDMFNPETRRSAIGRFGLMDAGLFNGDGLLPAIPCAWTRIEAGWEDPLVVTYSPGDLLTIHAPLSGDSRRVYKIPINEKEYFLVENRFTGKKNLDSLRYEMGLNQETYPSVKQVLLAHFSDQVTFSDSTGVLIDVENPDIGLPGGGCLIWHIDERVIEANREANRINANDQHRGVDLEEADGSQDIGQVFDFFSGGAGSELGTLLDPWYAGNTAPLYKNEFSSHSIPNSRSYYNRANSHIKICDFSARDSVMTFRVRLDIFQQNFPGRLPTEALGRVTSLKVSDVNHDGSQELLLTTANGQLLLIDRSGVAARGTDTRVVVRLDSQLIPPPALFEVPEVAGPVKGLVALSRSGKVYGLQFFTDGRVDTLFSPLDCGEMLTTPPVALPAADGSVVDVYWGGADGAVFHLILTTGEPVLEKLYDLPAGVTYLHVNGKGEVLAITGDHGFYRDGQKVGEVPELVARPAGRTAVAVAADGQIVQLDEELRIGVGAEDGLHRYDSPLIELPSSAGGDHPGYYAVGGDNLLFLFNRNFTLRDEFPVKMYDPYRPAGFFLTPLSGVFFARSGGETLGILLPDPAGLIDGFSPDGRRLDDFPLNVSDSLATDPALLDLDGDGDVELAAVTVSGVLYVWDLASRFTASTWNQRYADESNRNYLPEQDPGSPGVNPVATSAALLPAERVYNWPNPNTENFTLIRYYLTRQAQVSIKIYDLAGSLVSELPAPGTPLVDHEVRWDLSDVQSGVYLGRIEAKSGGLREVRVIKIAVVK